MDRWSVAPHTQGVSKNSPDLYTGTWQWLLACARVSAGFSSEKCTVQESANESAASAAFPNYVKFQAMIKSAASAASRKPKSREGSSRGVPRGRRPPAEAVVLHSPGASFPGFGLPGGCASSRLDHGLKFSQNPKKFKKSQNGFREAALAAD